MLGNTETGSTAERNVAGGVGVQNGFTITSNATHSLASGNYAVSFDSNGATVNKFRYLIGTTQGGSDILTAAIALFNGTQVVVEETLVPVGTTTLASDGSFAYSNNINPGTLSMTAGTYWLRFEYWYGDNDRRYADLQFTFTA